MTRKKKTSFELPSGFSRIAVAAVSIGLLLHVIGLSQKEIVTMKVKPVGNRFTSNGDTEEKLFPLGWLKMKIKMGPNKHWVKYSEIIEALTFIYKMNRASPRGLQKKMLDAYKLINFLGKVFIAFHIMGVILATTTCACGFVSIRNKQGNSRTFVGFALLCTVIANICFYAAAINLNHRLAASSLSSVPMTRTLIPGTGFWILMVSNVFYIIGLYFGYKKSSNNQTHTNIQLPVRSVQVTQIPLKAAPVLKATSRTPLPLATTVHVHN